MAITLAVEDRKLRPRSNREALRAQGMVPAIVYGHKVENTPVAVNAKELDKFLREHGKNTVISMTVDGKKINALVGETQVDTFTKDWEHVDFIAVDMSEEIEVEADVVLINEEISKGVKAGGVLVQGLYAAKVKATPDCLPERIEVDIQDLEKGQSITVADLPSFKDFVIVEDPEEVIVTIDEPKTQEELEAELMTDFEADQDVEVINEVAEEE